MSMADTEKSNASHQDRGAQVTIRANHTTECSGVVAATLNLTLGSKGHALRTAYARLDIDINTMVQPSITKLVSPVSCRLSRRLDLRSNRKVAIAIATRCPFPHFRPQKGTFVQRVHNSGKGALARCYCPNSLISTNIRLVSYFRIVKFV